jgi:anthranilate synthase/aminodeoxychorismate synthase-like glutamine amidotransferase
MILVLDNYDSFTYNLVQYLEVLHGDVQVVRNDAVTVEDIVAKSADAVVISPGPCTPEKAGVSIEAAKQLSGTVPILGVCLGHQAIVAAFGGRVVGAKSIMHGKTSSITHNGEDLFARLKSPFAAIRYHSLVAERESLPDCLEITAESDDGEIMGVRHREHKTYGVQFHPESILTTPGKRLLGNFLATADLR